MLRPLRHQKLSYTIVVLVVFLLFKCKTVYSLDDSFNSDKSTDDVDTILLTPDDEVNNIPESSVETYILRKTGEIKSDPVGINPDDDIETLDSLPETSTKTTKKIDEGPKVTGKGTSTDKTKSAKLDDYDYTNYDCLNTRYAPPTHRLRTGENAYVLTEARLRQIRSEFLYCFFDKGGDDGNGDYQHDIHSSIPQIHKNFNFQLPFFGFRYNYTRLSMNGYLEFSDPPEHYTYPLVFPVKDWPKKNDPAFIGIFFSKCRIGMVRTEDIDQKKAGVYFRLERDLQSRQDQFGVEMRERLKWDVREGIIGAETFNPKHAIIVTWKNMSFAGGIDNSLYRTNTFQLVLATDEVFTYAIFNYVNLMWSSHTEAGGDTTTGEGGVPAYIGFNGGNGTQSYEYKPYSQDSVLRDLVGRGWTNGFPGRHIFRIDEKILVGNCNKDIAGANLPLMFAPESGNMLGGTVINITGPCFVPGEKIQCRFDDVTVVGTVVDSNRAICVQPFIMAEGYVRFEIATGISRFNWKGKFFVETPATATERIFFDTADVHERFPAEIRITWDKYNLTSTENAPIRISLWGYRETTIRPELMYIDMLEESTVNSGSYVISPGNYRQRSNPATEDLKFGFIHINLTNPASHAGLTVSPVLWSKPIPLAWYFSPQWERKYGSRWSEELCNEWITDDRYLKNFAAEVPQCPCTLEHALSDKGRFLPDFDCDKDANPNCFYHRGAVHCVRSGAPSLIGSGQQCCYDKNGYLMLSYDQQWGSYPHRSHNLGFLPWNEANKVPTLSHWFHDMAPFYMCCLWQEEQAVGCETFRFERRPTQDCVAYQSPSVATIFGDPHIVTFDELEYTFNGKGEFVLIHANTQKQKLDVQGRFEQLPQNQYGEVRATQLTAVAARDNASSIIEVRLRPKHAQWRYHLDVLADGKKIYFDRPSLRIQHFPGVTVYMPTYVLNQSEIVIMFESGAGVEVVENEGFMTARVYLPWGFMNQTRGLFGNWSHDVLDDFTLPDGFLAGVSTGSLNNVETLHKSFALKWIIEDKEDPDKGVALFTREFGKTASSYANKTFEPEYRMRAQDIIPSNRTKDYEMAVKLCGDAYQCLYDYSMSLNRDMAHFTRNYLDSYSQIKAKNKERVISCGVLETPRFGRKSTFLFVPGTKVTFECNQDFILIGDQRRVCTEQGKWDTPEYGYTECLRQQEYSSRQIGITFGIILGVLVPLILLGAFLVFRYIKRNKVDDGSTASWNYKSEAAPFKAAAVPDKGFEAFRSSAVSGVSDRSDRSSSGSSSLGGFKKRRMYDRSYRTHEPIAGQPPVDFEDRLWDVGEEDETGITNISVTGSDDAPSDLSGQQEYSSRQAGITAGIVLAVLVPILLGLVCIAYHLLVKRKNEENYDVKDGKIPRMEPRLTKHEEFQNDELVALRKKETEVN